MAIAVSTRHRTKVEIGVAMLVGALAIFALHHLLAEVRWATVQAAISEIGVWRIALALVLTTASYLLLTLYDQIALRVIDQPLPYRTVALASFTSYTLSHNLGLALLTGGSARYRIYNQAGLGGGEIARVILLASLGFWMGVVTLGGGLMAWLGGATFPVPIPDPIVRSIGAGIVLASAGYVAWCGANGKSLRLAGWRLPLPPTRFAILQVIVSVADLFAASAALFVLVPNASPAMFPVLLLAYIVAIVVALVTHVPGGLGVFETMMLSLVPAVDRPELLGALLVYRAIYYLLPLLVATLLLAHSERRRWAPAAKVAARGLRAVSFGIVPQVMSALIFGGGLVLLLSGALPGVPHRLLALRHAVPLPFAEASHIAASLVGTALILIAPGLYRRQEAAFLIARALLLAGAAFSVAKGLDFEEAALMGSLALVLHVNRHAFYRQSLLVSRALSAEWIMTVGLAFGLSVWLGFFAYRDIAYRDELWWQFAWHGDAPRFLRASVAVAIFLAVTALWRLLRPAKIPLSLASGLSEAPLTAIARADRTEANLALTGDKRFLVSSHGDAFLMYQVQDHSWIAMGDPVGNPAAAPELMWRLRELADLAQGRALFYQITPAAIPVAIDMGLHLVKYGEEARVDLANFTLDGPAAKSLRYADRRAEREGARFEVVDKSLVPEMIPDLRFVSDSWVARRKGPEKCFSVGHFDPEYLARFDCAVVRLEGRIVAFANVWRTSDRSELSVDLMRYGEGAPYGVMDFLMIRLMQWGQENGYHWFSLGMAPLSGLAGRRLSPLWARFGALLYRRGDAFYGFEGLREYKEKFSPLWEARYIAGPRGLGLLRALIDLQRLVGGSRHSSAYRAPVSLVA